MRNSILLAFCAFALVALSTSCVKLQNKVILKGEWELVNFQIDTGSTNFMEVTLPGYNNPPGCCKYLIDFKDNDKVTGSYYIGDSLSYSVEGTWSLDEKNELHIKLDKYVDGLFIIDRQNRRTYQMTSERNTIEFQSGFPFETPTTLDIKRRDI